MTDVEPGDRNVLDLPEYQASIAEASDAFARLHNIETPKNVAGTPDGTTGTSGWTGEKAEATARARAEGVEAGHETEPHAFDGREGQGQFENSHSERHRAAGTNDQHFASAKEVCSSCQSWFSARAGLEERPQFVADPTGVRVFMPNGSRLLAPHPSEAVTLPGENSWQPARVIAEPEVSPRLRIAPETRVNPSISDRLPEAAEPESARLPGGDELDPQQRQRTLGPNGTDRPSLRRRDR